MSVLLLESDPFEPMVATAPVDSTGQCPRGSAGSIKKQAQQCAPPDGEGTVAPGWTNACLDGDPPDCTGDCVAGVFCAPHNMSLSASAKATLLAGHALREAVREGLAQVRSEDSKMGFNVGFKKAANLSGINKSSPWAKRGQGLVTMQKMGDDMHVVPRFYASHLTSVANAPNVPNARRLVAAVPAEHYKGTKHLSSLRVAQAQAAASSYSLQCRSAAVAAPAYAPTTQAVLRAVPAELHKGTTPLSSLKVAQAHVVMGAASFRGPSATSAFSALAPAPAPASPAAPTSPSSSRTPSPVPAEEHSEEELSGAPLSSPAIAQAHVPTSVQSVLSREDDASQAELLLSLSGSYKFERCSAELEFG